MVFYSAVFQVQAGLSCPVLVRWSRLWSSALCSTGCPLASYRLLWWAVSGVLISLIGGTTSSSPPLAQSCPTLFNPMNCSQSGSSLYGIFPLLCWKPMGSVQLPPSLLPASLCPAGIIKCSVRTQRWKVLLCGWWNREPDGKRVQGRGSILKSFPGLLSGCCQVGLSPRIIMPSLVLFWPWPSPRSSPNSSTEASSLTHIFHSPSLQSGVVNHLFYLSE